MGRGKKILFVAHDSKIEGGANRSLMSIIDYFDATDKYDIFVLVSGKQGGLIDWLEEKNITYIVASYKWQLVSQRGNLISKNIKLTYLFGRDAIGALRISRRLKKENIDLVYTNTRVVYFGCFLAAYLKVPHIMHCREFINEVMHRRAIFFSEEFLNRTTTTFVYISKAMRDVYCKLDGSKAEIVYNGIPILPDASIRNHGELIHTGKPRILLTGRIGEVKGQFDAIQAIKYLRDDYNCKAVLYLAGSGGDSVYNSKLLEYIENNGLKEQVVILGEVKDIQAVRNTVDVELVCSRFEAFGRVTIEAMNSGIPLIGANAPATDEIISDGINGLMYEVGNPEDLAKQIDMLIKDSDLRKKLIQNERSTVKDKFADIIMLQRVENVIDVAMEKEILI